MGSGRSTGETPARPGFQQDFPKITFTAYRSGAGDSTWAHQVSFDFAFSAMAARSDRSPAPWRRPFIRWLEGVDRGWSVPLLLSCFVGTWTAFLIIAYLGADLHPDVLEAWTLGRQLDWGNSKHPPLMGWAVHTWTLLFPASDWSLQLMAMTNSGIALWAVDLISRRFVAGDKRIIVLLLLMLSPVYQFHAQRFNANMVLLPLWPLATYCFLRAFESKDPCWATAAGLSSALAILGKYYSIFLIAGFLFAAILHPSRREYFRSASPWISTFFGLAALGPHVHWLAMTHAPTFSYALAHAHAGADLSVPLSEVFFFMTGLSAALAIPALSWVMIAGYRLKQMPDDFRTMSPGLWLLFLVAIGTIVFPILTSLVLRTDLPSLWGLQGLFLFVILVVCTTRYSIERFYSINLTVLVAGIGAIAVLVAAPIHAVYRNAQGYEEGRSFYRLAALALTRQWHGIASTQLSAVTGAEALALGAAFYSPDHPLCAHLCQSSCPTAPSESGWAAVCFAEQTDCIDQAENRAARAKNAFRYNVELRSNLLGKPGVMRKLVTVLVPP